LRFWPSPGFHSEQFRAHFQFKRHQVALQLLPASAYAQSADPLIAVFRESIGNLKTGERQC
jgi:hypothetical protein